MTRTDRAGVRIKGSWLLAAITLVAVLAAAPAARAAEYFVHPNGRSTGAGTINDPWDLVSALTPTVSVQPGDTIWLLGGTYNITGTLTCGLTGTEANPIVVRQYPVGPRATLDTGDSNLNGITLAGAHTWYWGFEVMSSSPNRWGNPPARGAGISGQGPGIKVINVICHDARSGIDIWTPAVNGQIYGCLIYYTGYDYSDRGHGHGIYTQNDASLNSTKWLTNNIMFAQYGWGVHAYTESGRIDNYVLEGNVSFDNGQISTISGGRTQFLIGGGNIALNPTVRNNYTYVKSGKSGAGLDLAYGKGVSGSSVTDNYLVGRNTAYQLKEAATPVISGNTFYGNISGFTPASYPDNTYHGLNRPTGTHIFVRPNAYEAGRGHIVVYNWDNYDTVDVDVSSPPLRLRQSALQGGQLRHGGRGRVERPHRGRPV